MNAEGFGPSGHFAGGSFTIMGVLVVLIVLAHVEHRQIPQRRHVHGFIEQPLAEGAVAEETDRHLIALAHLDRHRGAGGDAGAAADDGVGAQVAGVLVGDMHRAAFTPAISGFFAEQLGEHSVQRCAFSDAMTVAAVRAGDVIVLPQRFADTDGHRFFTNIKMRQPRHLGAEIKLIDLFFE